MAPDYKQKRHALKKHKPASKLEKKLTKPSSNDPHKIVFFKRHVEDDPVSRIPGREFLRSCPTVVRAKMQATLIAVAKAPPKRFAGGGRWEAMRDEMTGWFEVRVDFERIAHYRLFCRIDLDAFGEDAPLLVVIDGGRKEYGTAFNIKFYQKIQKLGDEYFSRNPRSIV